MDPVLKMTVASEAKRAMGWLAQQPEVLFIGQGALAGGHAMARSLEDVSSDKRIEFPVAEELQLGVSIGLSLEGFVPVSIYPRWNFLLCAMNQLVNHLDRIPLYSDYMPRVLVRVGVGSAFPLDPGQQHQDDCTEAVTDMLKKVAVMPLNKPSMVYASYRKAYRSEGSALLVEYPDTDVRREAE